MQSKLQLQKIVNLRKLQLSIFNIFTFCYMIAVYKNYQNEYFENYYSTIVDLYGDIRTTMLQRI